jgi:hypothetical protein
VPGAPAHTFFVFDKKVCKKTNQGARHPPEPPVLYQADYNITWANSRRPNFLFSMHITVRVDECQLAHKK